MRMHLKILIQIFGDPHTWFIGAGIGIAFTPEMAHNAAEYVKLYCAIIGALIITASGLHKWIKFRKEKK